jgi:endonuclease G
MRWLILMMLLAFGAHAEQAPPECATQFFGGEMPVITEALAEHSRTVCFSQYMVLDSSTMKIPLWVAEHLTPDRIAAAKAIPRKNEFHAETNLTRGERSELADYFHSGYDRGHMAPKEDMPDANSEFESFSLANMIPQNRCNNEIIWKSIEEATRKYVTTSGNDLYVQTGPVVEDEKTTGNGVRVPSKIFKALYDPKINSLMILVTPNANVTTFDLITRDQLRAMTGVTVFPNVPEPQAGVFFNQPHVKGTCKKETG